MSPSPSDPSSSLFSLSRSLKLASALPDLQPSPESHGTGATGSSEVRGSASRSIARSAAQRSISDQSDAPLSPPNFFDSPCKSSDQSWEEVGRSGRLEELVLPTAPASRKSATDDDDGELVSAAAEEGAGRYVTLSHSQEEAGLGSSITRSQSDFSRWLETTIAQARGDGTSVVGSESASAYSALASATREARIGLGGSAGNPGLGSAFSAHDFAARRMEMWDESTESSFNCAGGGLRQSSELLKELQQAAGADWTGSTFDKIKAEESEDVKPLIQAEVTEKETSVKSESSSDFSDEISLEPLKKLVSCSSNTKWKLATFALASYVVLPHVRPYYPLIASVLFGRATESVAEEAVASSTIALNETLAPIPFPTPLTVGAPLSLTAYATAVALLVMAVAGSTVLTSRPAKVVATVASDRSPLLELNASSILRARELLPRAQLAYNQSNLTQAESVLVEILSLACAPLDKSIACELLGRTRFRLACQDPHSRDKMASAAETFARAVRMNPQSASAKAEWGRALFRLGEINAAVRPLKSALVRDDNSALAHEFLGKVLMALGEREKAELHFRRAVDLCPVGGYTALAFLGEQLHLAPGGGKSRAKEAKELLERAVAIRADYPAAHARLAFIATESLDNEGAAKHLRMVLATRENGLVDPDLAASSAATWGASPFLNLFFLTPATLDSIDPNSRPALLRRAMVEYGTTTPLLGVLLALSLAASVVKEEQRAARTELATLEAQLGRRSNEYRDDLEAEGLWALCLMGVEGKKREAERVYASFWKKVSAGAAEGEGAGAGEKRRELSFLVLALYEQRGKKATMKA